MLDIFRTECTKPMSTGVFVHPSIVPGFRYYVRHCDKQNYLFEGRALALVSVGLGYGKRLTFSGDSLNENNNFFGV